MDRFKLLLYALIILCPEVAYAQSHYDNIWLFSDISGAVQVDFSTGTPEVSEVGIPIIFEKASAQVSDAEGRLQFYTNGCEIYNFNHELMDGGANLNPGRVYDDYCGAPQRGYPSAPQSVVILPVPLSKEEYLILHKPKEFNDIPINGEFSDANRSMYTVVDMKENEGLGKVVVKNILYDSFRVELVQTFTKHANGVDWWMISPWRDSSVFSIYLIDSSGIQLSSVQEIGLKDNLWTRSGGQDIFSPQGDKFYRFNSTVGIQQYDFNRETGMLSNFELIPMPLEDQPPLPGWGGIGISPSGQYAYASTIFTIYQYDLWADDVEASRLTVGLVGNPDSLWAGVAPTAFNFQLGPDCKLYNFTNTGDKHHVIHNPDERGLACGWEQGWLELPFNVFRDQIYFPNFRLGPLGSEGSPCAKPIVSSTNDLVEQGREYLKVFPNPAGEYVSVTATEDLPDRKGTWELYDMLGRRVSTLDVRAGATATLRREQLTGGMYAWRLVADGRVVGSGKLLWR